MNPTQMNELQAMFDAMVAKIAGYQEQMVAYIQHLEEKLEQQDKTIQCLKCGEDGGTGKGCCDTCKCDDECNCDCDCEDTVQEHQMNTEVAAIASLLGAMFGIDPAELIQYCFSDGK